MSEIKWLPEALADIGRLYAFLNDKNPEAAQRAARAILDGTELLKATPQIGRPMNISSAEPDDTRRRELFISFGAGAYVLRYILENPHTAVIIRVWHSRESRTE